MLGKLSKFVQGGGDKSLHPLGSKENLEQAFSGISQSSPANVLLEVVTMLEDIGRYDDELSPAALRRAILHIEDFARAAYEDQLLVFVLPISREQGSEAIWSSLDKHNRLLFKAYMHCLEAATTGKEDLSKEKMPLALCATRAMHAWVEGKKLGHFRYRPPDEAWWQASRKLISIAGQLGIATLPQVVFSGETLKRSMLHIYLAGLYTELAPTSNLIMPQVEILHRWLEQISGTLEFAETPNPGTTHVIDLAYPAIPARYKPEVKHTPTHRYCSTRRMRMPLMQFGHALQQKEAPPDWLKPMISERKALAGLVKTLLLHWPDQPPARGSERQTGQQVMRVVYGFDMARRMIACSDFARRGRTLKYEGVNFVTQFRSRFGDVNPNTVDIPKEEKADPMETLQKLETMGDKQMMEQWLKVDVSKNGLGAVMPGLRSKHRIGELLAFRFEDSIEWQLAFIRRIGRNMQMKVSIGLETLPVPSLCARVRPQNVQLTAWSLAYEAGSSYVDAILLADSDCLLLPLGLFADDLAVILNVDGRKQNIVLLKKEDSGSDWERVRFRTADA